MLILLNPHAQAGGAASRWWRIAPELHRRLGPFRTVVPPTRTLAVQALRDALMAGERTFIAAGGDGTVNLVLSALLAGANGARDQLVLGAVGLGSSNDFHKPLRDGLGGGVPARVDVARARPHDVCTLDWLDQGGAWQRRWWIVNASVGVTANGNLLYNRARGLIGFVKRRSRSAAMVLAVARAVATARPLAIRLAIDGALLETVTISNLGIVKNPHFTGVLRYDSPLEPASGRLWIHVLQALPRMNLLRVLAGLAVGRFTGTRIRSFPARALTIEADQPFALEADGEVVVTRAARMEVVAGAVRVCP